ncbi:hypothetical protein BGZ61DRAFT_447610 [Ilyonectria robusta]|uniref:uncharacterized protein n=1 Tax=Ilyonectria robusta TaxID=1079257 RepID=UPI001E8E0C09|nr:uncharacterized protein BGZ61DRAFT_447610 [Ilyonectria robusta]KAH8721892.1 hypothetical protein BGZ61DRAFT_447610 [Ilyonectria robusta]
MRVDLLAAGSDQRDKSFDRRSLQFGWRPLQEMPKGPKFRTGLYGNTTVISTTGINVNVGFW